MATHWGVEGTCKFGSNAIAEITNFTVESTANPVDDSAMGDTWHTHIATSGMNSWTAEVTCHWDETDTNGQVAATIGASVTLNMYPEGSTSGDSYLTGTASVVKVGVAVPMDGATISRTLSFLGNGALSVTVV